MPGPWGPPTLNPLGFVAYHAGLSRGDSGHRERAITKGPRERLLKVMNRVDAGALEGEDKKIFAGIDKNRSWLLTPREKALLERLKHQKVQNIPK